VLVTDGVGSILSGGGDFPSQGALPNTPQTWADQINAIEKYSIDNTGCTSRHLRRRRRAWHNDILNATLFPHQIGFGATFDPQLVKDVQTRRARPRRRPTCGGLRSGGRRRRQLAVGRYNESYSEDRFSAAAWPQRGGGPETSDIVAATSSTSRLCRALERPRPHASDMSLRNFEENQLPSYKEAIDAGVLT